MNVEYKKKLSAARHNYLKRVNYNLGMEHYKSRIGVLIKVEGKDYPDCVNHTYNKNRTCNPQFKWILKSHKVWVDAGNKIPPKGYIIFHLDGDPFNNSIDNLKCIPRSLSATMAKKNRFTNNKEVNSSNLLLTELEHTINRRANAESSKKQRKSKKFR